MRPVHTHQRRTGGFTLIEVMMAITVLGIVLAAVSFTMMSSMRQNHAAGNRSQAAQVMNYLGRRIAGGDISKLGGTSWDYGTLATSFTDLSRESNLADTDLYRAEVAEFPRIGLGGTTIPHYRVTVCWNNGGDESCVSGDTAGPGPGAASGESLPGIN
ncbi:MAG: type II secretion system protein [Trueperaceae bacterium]|nr:type II secretion system protein [Trueperaceae bacterium]MCW5819782.1 type II secretion system protein [Trueperaceae bacterium]